MIKLVTDRTENDVLLRNEKGVYKAEDINRVEIAVEEVKKYLSALGSSVQLSTKTDWELHDGFSASADPTESQMNRYIKNVAKIRDIFNIPIDLPTSMNFLTFDGANKIEEVLETAIAKAEATVQSYFYSGEIYAGEGF